MCVPLLNVPTTAAASTTPTPPRNRELTSHSMAYSAHILFPRPHNRALFVARSFVFRRYLLVGSVWTWCVRHHQLNDAIVAIDAALVSKPFSSCQCILFLFVTNPIPTQTNHHRHHLQTPNHCIASLAMYVWSFRNKQHDSYYNSHLCLCQAFGFFCCPLCVCLSACLCFALLAVIEHCSLLC